VKIRSRLIQETLLRRGDPEQLVEDATPRGALATRVLGVPLLEDSQCSQVGILYR
jgi:hypothetical protein